MDLLLDFEPQELNFILELNKKLESSISLRNKTENHVAFKLLTTQSEKYGVQPRIGILSPGSSCVITVKRQALRTTPVSLRCKDKFMIRSVVASPGASTQDAQTLFNQAACHMIREYILKVVFSLPTSQAPSVPTYYCTRSSLAITPKITDSVASTSNDVLQMDCQLTETPITKKNVQNLLEVQPSELQFPLKLEKDFSHSFQLSNTTENHVAFLVKTANPLYSVQPSWGIVSPQSMCDVTVKSREQNKVPSDITCEDKFIIRSTISSPLMDREDIVIQDLFNELGSIVEECEVGINYIVKEKTSIHIGGLIRKGVIFSLMVLASWYLMKHALSLIWSLIEVIMTLVIKMIQKLVSESLEDWIVKALLYVITHLLFKWRETLRLSTNN